MKHQSSHITLTFGLIVLFVLYSVSPAWAMEVERGRRDSHGSQNNSDIDEKRINDEIVPDRHASKRELEKIATNPETFTIGNLEVTNVSDLSEGNLLPVEAETATVETATAPTDEPKLPVDLPVDLPLAVSEVVATAAPTLTVMVNVINDDLGKNSPQDFIMNISGGQAMPSTFRGNSTATNIELTPNVNYALSVPTLTYQATLSEGCQGNLVPGQTATCQVNLNDVPKAPSNGNQNLITNPDVEIERNPTVPMYWLTGGYGYNNQLYNYPVLSRDGDKALNVTISDYTDGDAKWYFEKVPVIAGHTYKYSNIYSADVPTELTVEYFDQNENHLSFGGFISVPKTNGQGDWQTASATIIPPLGAHFLTVFHNLKSNGSLSTDKFNLTEVAQPESFDQGFVSVVFDDGLDSQFNNAFPKLSLADIKGTFYLITHAISGLSIQNAKLDNPVDSDGNFNWKAYISSAEYKYPVPGRTGTAAYAKSTELNSNAAWFFDPIEVLNDSVYSFSEWYKSTTDTELVAVINKLDGTAPINADVTDENGQTIGISVPLPSTGNVWKEVKTHFYIPVDTKDVTVVNRLKGIGEVTIDDVSFGALPNMDIAQVQSLINDGQEIGLHTRTHKDLTAISEEMAANEIKGSMFDAIQNGLNQIFSFTYPYGLNNQSIQKITKDSGFTSGRSVSPGFNGRDTNPYNLLTESVNADTSLAQVESWINQAHNDRSWLVLVFHDIVDNTNSYPFGTTPPKLQSILDYLNDNQVTTKTVTEGVQLMNQATPNPVLSKIVVSPDLPQGVVGDTLQLTAKAYDKNSVRLVVQPTFTWTSSNPLIVKIDAVSGFAEAIGVGTAIISAKSGTVVGSTQATVNGGIILPVITTISISPSNPVGVISDKVNFIAKVFDQNGAEIIPTPAIIWTSSKPNVVSINQTTGAAVAVGDGVSQITATIGSVNSQTNATVNKSSVPAITLTKIAITHPANKIIYKVGESLDLSGLEVSGQYSDGHIEKISITSANVTGFNSSSPAKEQILTIMVAGKSTTYKVTIKSGPIPPKKNSGSSVYFNKFWNSQNNNLSGHVLGAEHYKFNFNLKFGMQSDAVLELQRRLKEVSAYDGPLTGYYGILTKDAVEQYQAAYGLSKDGVVGPMTRNILNT